eukprot:550571-Pelagomonas_calceolata.AAC.2
MLVIQRTQCASPCALHALADDAADPLWRPLHTALTRWRPSDLSMRALAHCTHSLMMHPTHCGGPCMMHSHAGHPALSA